MSGTVLPLSATSSNATPKHVRLLAVARLDRAEKELTQTATLAKVLMELDAARELGAEESEDDALCEAAAEALQRAQRCAREYMAAIREAEALARTGP